MRLWGPALGLAATLGCGAGYELASATSVATSTASATNGSTGEGEDAWADSGTEDLGGCDFLTCMDVWRSPTFGCDLWLQDCPRGSKCMPWADDGGNSWNATKCTALDPKPHGLYEACVVEGSGVSGFDSCELGTMCWDVDPQTGEGSCVAICQGSEQAPFCEDPDAKCFIAGGGVLLLCLPQCDPLVQDCREGQSCYEFYAGFVCARGIAGSGEGGVGQPCQSPIACDPGLTCAAAVSVAGCESRYACCTPYCDLLHPGADAACPGYPANRCVPAFEHGKAEPGFEHLGVCAIPEGR